MTKEYARCEASDTSVSGSSLIMDDKFFGKKSMLEVPTLDSKSTDSILRKSNMNCSRSKKRVQFTDPLCFVREIESLDNSILVGSASAKDDYRDQASRRLEDQNAGWFDMKSLAAMVECDSLRSHFFPIWTRFIQCHGCQFGTDDGVKSETMPEVLFNCFSHNYYLSQKDCYCLITEDDYIEDNIILETEEQKEIIFNKEQKEIILEREQNEIIFQREQNDMSEDVYEICENKNEVTLVCIDLFSSDNHTDIYESYEDVYDEKQEKNDMIYSCSYPVERDSQNIKVNPYSVTISL
eukprot:GHVL01041888.1.p1 GENE.GHVL01041888.1~~GHVL01041888.1.p1  ORF type:complete len:295 (+),score=58.36 GHVL01041888.1:957-1841(+)